MRNVNNNTSRKLNLSAHGVCICAIARYIVLTYWLLLNWNVCGLSLIHI